MLLVVPVDWLRKALGLGDHVEVTLVSQSRNDHATNTFLAEISSPVLPVLPTGAQPLSTRVPDFGSELDDEFTAFLEGHLLASSVAGPEKDLRRIELTDFDPAF
jgi:hypothetical protein